MTTTNMMDRSKKWFDAWHEKYGKGRPVIIGFGFYPPNRVGDLLAAGAQLIVVDDPMLAEWVREHWERNEALAINPSPTNTCLCVCPYQ